MLPVFGRGLCGGIAVARPDLLLELLQCPLEDLGLADVLADEEVLGARGPHEALVDAAVDDGGPGPDHEVAEVEGEGRVDVGVGVLLAWRHLVGPEVETKIRRFNSNLKRKKEKPQPEDVVCLPHSDLGDDLSRHVLRQPVRQRRRRVLPPRRHVGHRDRRAGRLQAQEHV